jgi:LL-H family phage holin
MHDALLQLLYDVIAILVPVLVGYLVAWIQKKLGTEKVQKIAQELQTKQELARIGVQFVQQAYKDLGGPEKYEKAAEWLSDMAMKMGLALTDEEIKALIEAALKELKAEFGETWNDISK